MLAAIHRTSRRFALLYLLGLPTMLVGTAWFAYRPSGLGQLAVVLCVFAVPPLLVGGLSRIKKYTWLGLGAALASLIVVPAGCSVGRTVRRVDFEHRLRPKYEALINRTAKDVAVGELKIVPVPQNLRGDAHAVHAMRSSTGVLSVVFFWGGGFPARHTAFIYRANGAWEDDPRLDWRVERLNEKWFRGS